MEQKNKKQNENSFFIQLQVSTSFETFILQGSAVRTHLLDHNIAHLSDKRSTVWYVRPSTPISGQWQHTTPSALKNSLPKQRKQHVVPMPFDHPVKPSEVPLPRLGVARALLQ